MRNSEWDLVIHEYATLVKEKQKTDEQSSAFSDCGQFRGDRIQELSDWQIAFPIIACMAAGGSVENGIILASAWVSLHIASEILDEVEDKEFIPDRFLPSSEIASNLATGLIFESFHTLTFIKDADKAIQISRIFSNSGSDSVYGQHRDLLQTPAPVEMLLNNYWETTILKSGSVFRAAAEASAVAGGADETIAEALADYGTNLGVMLQLMDDCRDAFNPSQEAIHREITLPLLLYLMAIGEESVIYPEVRSRAEWHDLLTKTGVIQAITALLLQWKSRALDSISPLRKCREKRILESIPSLFLERIPSMSNELMDENNI